MDFKNDLYEILFGAIQEGLILVNSEGVIIELNKTGNEMFGYEESELLGQKIEVLVPMKARGEHQKHRDQYNEHPTSRSMGSALKLDGVRKDGSEFPVQVSLNPFESQTGEKFVVALVSDVTERRENEKTLLKLRESLEQKVKERTKELRESEKLYKSIARNFPSGVISIFDKSYRYLFAEGQGLYELGIETSDLIGLDYLNRIDSRARVLVKQELDKVFKGESKNFEVNVGKKTYSLSAVPLSDAGTEVDRILVVEKNITAEKEVSKKLEETLKQERELTEMKSRFVSMASHEFRTPLTTINSSATLIKKYHEKKSYDKLDKHTDRIKNSVRNLTAILNDFLSFEKLEANQMKASFAQWSIPNILQETFEEIADIIIAEQKIVYKGPKELILLTDGQLLKNSMLNMLSNAIKYSKAKGEIIVRLEEMEEKIVISIQDFGMGIPLNDQKNLFTRFFRAGNVTNIEGTGLGLNIVVRYLDLLKGEISFKSKEGEGTIFFITLPKEK
ncbi:sensor histidine kinase [Brumimicrobium oceani]|uniref:histidine kinase n=1 Tax=Brumimicrobium oceani TaxID=2100725 RepID=A0A2U2X0Z3_9FLAO|nr:PAS domain-containing sensor histidine kinase [Brumimicrobium oceani]PWH81451.1 hybrid sensor histidine kinase/response regulator [Brumimicrobium oceani]